MMKRSNTRPQAEQTTDVLATQRERAARLRDAAGRFSRRGAEPAAERSQAEAPLPKSVRVPCPPAAHPDTYALRVDEDGLGLHAPPGANVLVEPVAPLGAGLAVFHSKHARGPTIFDLTHDFRPEYARPFAPGSEVMPLVEVIDPATGEFGRIRADRFDTIHRVIGIYTPADVGLDHRRAPKPLPLMSECPDGMGEEYVKRAAAYPLVRPGETVIYDPARREPTDGALCVLEWRSGRRSVLLTNLRAPGGRGEARWFADPVNRPPSRAVMERRHAAGTVGTLYASEGPFTEEHLREVIVGTVVGILVPRRKPAPQNEPIIDVVAPAAETPPAGEQQADPIFAAIKRHVAARAACVGLDDREDEEGFEAAHNRATEALNTVEGTQPTTVAGLLALARHMDRYLNEDAGGQNVVTPTAEGHAFVGLINACLGLAAVLDVDAPLTVESAAPMPFDALELAAPLRNPNEWTAEFAAHALGMHAADKTLRMTKPELIAFVRGAAERGNGADEAVFKAIDNARETFEGWAQALDVARGRYLVAAAAMTVEDEARQVDQSGEA